jgi:hypothetical protein
MGEIRGGKHDKSKKNSGKWACHTCEHSLIFLPRAHLELVPGSPSSSWKIWPLPESKVKVKDKGAKKWRAMIVGI